MYLDMGYEVFTQADTSSFTKFLPAERVSVRSRISAVLGKLATHPPCAAHARDVTSPHEPLALGGGGHTWP